MYRLDQPSDNEWQKVVITKYFIQWIPHDEIRALYTKKLDTGLVIHKDYVNFIHQWSQSPIVERKGINTTQSFTKLPSESVMLNLNVNVVDEVETDVWINRWVKDDTLKTKLRHIATVLTKETDLSYYTNGSFLRCIWKPLLFHNMMFL